MKNEPNVTLALQQAISTTRGQIKFLQEKEKSLLVALEAVSGKVKVAEATTKVKREWLGLNKILPEAIGTQSLSLSKIVTNVRKQPGFRNIPRAAVVKALAYCKKTNTAVQIDAEKQIWCLTQEELDRRTKPSEVLP